MCESPMDRDAPVMLAWATFKATEAYENAARWAVSPQDTEGSLWRAFLEGYTAAASAPPADADPKCYRCDKPYPFRIGFCEECWNAHVAAPPADAATEAVRDKNIAYHERNMVVAALSKLFPAWLMPHRDEPGQEWDAKWRTVVAIQLPTGQVTWHVDDAEVGLFGHLDWRVDMTWDGHDTEEKYRRLAALSTPAPAPSTDPWRACGCPNPDNCEHVYYSPAAPSAPAMRRCEQPEVEK